MEGASGDDFEDQSDLQASKKRYHRHTVQQTRQLEMFFKECPHPDEKQRQELGRELGLEPRQVKFWFQNRRTQMKAHHERADNSILRAENENLRTENIALREALKDASCPKCGGQLTPGEMSFTEQQLRIENARLRDELNRVSALVAKYITRSAIPLNILPDFPFDITATGTSDSVAVPSILEVASRPGGVTESEKPVIAELAIVAMEELLLVAAETDGALWSSVDGTKEVLSQEEYFRQFPRGLGPRLMGMETEASRETGLVMMNAAGLIDTIMNVMGRHVFEHSVKSFYYASSHHWRRRQLEQRAATELQILSPLVPTREFFFLRYCKQHSERVWAIVDVSIDGLRDNPAPQLRCRMRPSGFFIEDLQNGYSKVTAVQHIEADHRQTENIYHGLMCSGAAFGAKRWLAILQRQCERLGIMLTNNISARDLGVIPNANGRRSMLFLAQRMTSNYCAGVSASIVHTWTTLSGAGEEDIRVMTRKSVNNPGEPPGIVLSAATSLWVPVNSQRLFEFLRDERLRSEWDILSNGGAVQEIARVATGQDPGCVVSLLRVGALNTSQSNMLILQESCTDASGSLIVYAPVDIPAMNLVMQGGDPATVALLPSGFAISPDGAVSQRTTQEGGGAGGGGGADLAEASSSSSSGALLTVAFQILVSNVPTAKLNLESVATVNSLISSTVQRIKTALGCC
ncbi:homeobox-leucine zipper protein MERISTEM L1 isoform X2 [Selaginella moellendorffii]|uniref:homeobox-leucine zipper protein MERISTEM L1 isoform X2 n=1 Tax=Selaginella moellendorffii TaxID=88036 RepID=UPI000D1C79A5|nr:homeobox-leucine zipper protein MERISTEM L1 isoform X2 [Selaginella moellendorffii]|eukprot:XP_024514927.1 homeobox-leucine zipper protein MERISTEM L1 isoform X2 [Selaginella moellendorffii]